MKGTPQALAEFYRGKRVAITGHTGFKGAWLALWLKKLGAEVLGIALEPTSPLSNYSSTGLDQIIDSRIGDVRDLPFVATTLEGFRPEIVFHLAAQALVGVAYEDPVTTFHTNVIGSVNVMQCARTLPGLRALLMITSDKCYQNVEQIWGYREIDRLGGDDPYSASKACAENAIQAFSRSYFGKEGTPHIASARAGNVVGGGDWSKFRLIPDCIRSLREGTKIGIRNPQATRPWQHVLDPLAGYLMLAMRLHGDRKISGAWNFGPPVNNNNTVDKGARTIIRNWGSGEMELTPETLFHENMLLQLDCSKSRQQLGWHPVLDFEATMAFTTAWYKRQFDSHDGNMRDYSYGQIDEFEKMMA